MPVTLTSVYKGDIVYERTVREFHQSWDGNAGPHPHVMQVFKVEHHHDDAARHKAAHHAYAERVGNVQYLFHGTKRTCRTGDHRSWNKPCNLSDCFLCSILKLEFDFNKAGSAHGSLFGKGLYTTSSSTKATYYAESTDPNTNTNAMLLSHVIVGKTCMMNAPDPSLTGPPPPYDSVTGATYAQGGSLPYPETIVYRPEAVCVAAVIVYTA